MPPDVLVPLSIGARLTLWYSGALFAVLVTLGAGLYVANSRLRLDQLDAELARSGETLANVLMKEMDEEADLRAAAREAQQDFPPNGPAFAVYDAAGVALTSIPGEALSAMADADTIRRSEGSRSVDTPRGRWRVHAHAYEHRGQTFYVADAESLRVVEREQALLGRTLTIAIPVALLLAGAGGLLMARHALRPVAVMAAQSEQINDRTPGFRLSVPNPHDELGVLATAFNGLVDRLEGALAAQRRFMADASHELRTPVTVLRTTSDVTLSRERSAEEYRDAMAIMAAQARRLTRMVDDMFTLARGDSGALNVDGTDFYFDELVADCVRDASVLARERQVGVQRHGREEVMFHGDEALLRRMMLNLLDNAVRHTPDGGRIDVSLDVAGSSVTLDIADTGGGIPPEDRERIFERFVRLDPARGSNGGAGLGLAIARSIAEAHRGELALVRSSSSGSVFRVRLPAHAAEAGAAL